MEPAPGPSPVTPTRQDLPFNQFDSGWGGYVLCAARDADDLCGPGNSSDAGFESVNGAWTQPGAVSTDGSAEVGLTFVGIGGYGTEDLVAAGTALQVGPGDSATVTAWWELTPNAAQPVVLSPNPAIAVGDIVRADIIYDSTLSNGSQTWRIFINDSTTGSSWSALESCYPSQCTDSSFASVEWIEGVPVTNGTAGELPAFGNFSYYALYRHNGSATQLAPVNGITLDLQQPTVSSGDFVETGAVQWIGYTGSIFQLSYMVDLSDPIVFGDTFSVSPTSVGPGTDVNIEVPLWAATGFTGSGPARLSLEAEISNGASNCSDPEHASTGFNVTAGRTETYPTELEICPGLPGGRYQLQVWVYYDPAGLADGAAETQLLDSSGWLPTQLTVVDFTPTTPALRTGSLHTDVGGTVNLSAAATILGQAFPPYVFQFSNAPNGCNYPISSPTPNASIACHPMDAGNFTIFSTVTVGSATLVSRGSVELTVLPEVTVRLTADPTQIESSGSISLEAAATGGDGLYQYAWSGLPFGCPSSDAPELTCSPALFGNYTVGVNVTDDTGAPGGNASVRVQVALPLVVLLLANYSTIPSGFVITFRGGAAGGFGPYGYSWSGLPAPCTGRNDSTLTCAPTATGKFHIRLTATDALGASNTSTFELNVSMAGGPLLALGLTTLGIAVLVLVPIIAIGVVVAFVIHRRSGRSGPPSR